MAFFSWSTIKSLFFILASILPKQSSRSETAEPELALNSSSSSSAAAAAARSSESTNPEGDPSTTSLGELAIPAVISVGIYGSTSSSSSAAAAAARSSESTNPEGDPSTTSLGELAIPAVISVGIYGSIPQAVHVDHRHAPLYEPLVAFVCLGVFTSLGGIICVLLRPGARGVALLMGSSVVFLLVAFLLRILLLP